MTNPGMTLVRLTEICAAYGHDSRRWPAQERAAAEALANTTKGQEITKQAAALDADLDRYSVSSVDARLRKSILAAASATPRAVPGFLAVWLSALRNEIFGWRPAAYALTLALILGLVAGLLDEGVEPVEIMHLAGFQQIVEDY